MTDGRLVELAHRVRAAAAGYRAALGADLDVTGVRYANQARMEASRLIEIGRQYEALADRLQVSRSRRLPWTGYLLHSSGADVFVSQTVPLDEADDGEPAEETASDDQVRYDVATLLNSSLEVIDQTGSVDQVAWTGATKPDSDPASTDASLDRDGSVRTRLDARAEALVTELIDSQSYRDALKHNLQLAQAWIAATDAVRTAITPTHGEPDVPH